MDIVIEFFALIIFYFNNNLCLVSNIFWKILIPHMLFVAGETMYQSNIVCDCLTKQNHGDVNFEKFDNQTTGRTKS